MFLKKYIENKANKSLIEKCKELQETNNKLEEKIFELENLNGGEYAKKCKELLDTLKQKEKDLNVEILKYQKANQELKEKLNQLKSFEVKYKEITEKLDKKIKAKDSL